MASTRGKKPERISDTRLLLADDGFTWAMIDTARGPALMMVDAMGDNVSRLELTPDRARAIADALLAWSGASPSRHRAAVALGQLTSAKKAATARENGKKGGRPKAPPKPSA